MNYRIDIRYPAEEIIRNKRRLESTYQFEFFDRVPVLLGIEARYILHERSITFSEYFSDPRTQLIHQLENIKWRIENIPDDWLTTESITVSPDFQNVTNASGCGCEIFWQENETPHTHQRFTKIEEMCRFEFPEWRSTLWGKKLEWYQKMSTLVEDVEVILNGERIPVHVSLSINGDSPFMTAVELAGANFYMWLLEDADACLGFLHRITDRYVEVETAYRKLSNRPLRDGLNYSDDSAQVISLKQYRMFCVPIARRLYDIFGSDRFDGRLMHLCGRNVHLHPALLNDLGITLLHGFGSANTPGEMSLLAGKVILQGNIDPMTLYQGSVADVETETQKILEILGPSGGLILSDGFNVVPGTSLEMLATVKETSQRFGIPRQAA